MAEIIEIIESVIFDQWMGEVTRYVVGRLNTGRWFFAWTDRGRDRFEEGEVLPVTDENNGDRGVSFHPSARKALEAAKAVFDILNWKEGMEMLATVQATGKRTKTSIYLDSELLKELKVIAAMEGTTMTELIERAIQQWLAQHKK